MSRPTPCCATCEYWSNVEPTIATAIRRPLGADNRYGICRRFPPTIVEESDGQISSRFPEIFGARICGDWSPDFEPDGGGGPDGGDGPDGGESVLYLAAERARRAA